MANVKVIANNQMERQTDKRTGQKSMPQIYRRTGMKLKNATCYVQILTL